MLSDEKIDQFIALYKNHFGRELSRAEAYEKGIKLMRLIELIYKPMTKQEYDNLQKRREETKEPQYNL